MTKSSKMSHKDEGEEKICTYLLRDSAIEVRGEWGPTTPENEYESYRFYENGVCLNPDDPMDASGGATFPTKAEVSTFLGTMSQRNR